VAQPLNALILPRARTRRLSLDLAPALLAAAVVAYLVLVPLGFLLWRTFFEDGRPTLAHLRAAYAVGGLTTTLVSTLEFAAGTTLLALALGTALAWVLVRTDVPGRRLLTVGVLVPLVLPGVLHTFAWIFLAAPRTGLVNEAFHGLLGVRPLHVFGLGGMIGVEGLHLAPLAFLLVAAGLRSIDPTLEEAALAAGARPLAVMRRITLALVRPALAAAALIVLVRALEAFEVPTLLGTPGGVQVFTTRVWDAVSVSPATAVARAGAYALPLIGLTILGTALLALVSRGRGTYEAIGGRGFPQRRAELGRLRFVAAGAVSIYVLVAAVLPLAALLWISLQPYYAAPSRAALSRVTLAGYRQALSAESLDAIKTSVLLAAGSATVVVAITALAAWLVVRTRLPGRRLVDQLALVPLALPGLVFGVALLAFYGRPALPVYGTIWILLIAYVTRFLPFGMRSTSVSFLQVGRELEESARTSGASFTRTFTRVLLPLAAPGLAAGWLAVAVFSVRELSSSLLLVPPGRTVLAVELWDSFRSGELAKTAALGVLTTVGLALLTWIAYRLGAVLRHRGMRAAR
jgi:iron(III) transport system permease protein